MIEIKDNDGNVIAEVASPEEENVFKAHEATKERIKARENDLVIERILLDALERRLEELKGGDEDG